MPLPSTFCALLAGTAWHQQYVMSVLVWQPFRPAGLETPFKKMRCLPALPRYETELEAARAYDRAVLAYVGTSAPLNVSFSCWRCLVTYPAEWALSDRGRGSFRVSLPCLCC